MSKRDTLISKAHQLTEDTVFKTANGLVYAARGVRVLWYDNSASSLANSNVLLISQETYRLGWRVEELVGVSVDQLRQQAARGGQSMTKYRKRPIVIEARGPITEPEAIETLEGTMTASVGDYVITGTRGEMYPCKPDVFSDVYEPVVNPRYLCEGYDYSLPIGVDAHCPHCGQAVEQDGRCLTCCRNDNQQGA